MIDLLCIQCGKPRELGSRMCNECHKEKKRQEQKERYNKYGRYAYGKGKCIKCGKEITLWKKEQKFCKACVAISRITSDYGLAEDNYVNAGGDHYCFLHRRIAEYVLNRKLTYNELVHHLDENPGNNIMKNLIILSRKNHGKLHSYLRAEWNTLLNEYNIADSLEERNKFKTLVSLAWIETNKIKVIKLWEISKEEVFFEIKDTLSDNNSLVKEVKQKVLNKCIICGKDCENKYCSQTCNHIAQRRVERPSKEVLMQNIKDYPLTSIGKKYGVSDNAIRRWIKAYNI